MLLGDLGADVIKVERPERGDDLREWRARTGRPGMSAVFAAINRNKRGIALDLQKPDGGRILRDLAARSDVLVENFVPGVADRLGVGYQAVSAVNPAIVYVSVSGFGQTGPYAQRPGYNTIAQGMGGLMGITGMPGHPPTRAGGSIADVAAAYLSFGAVNAALVHRLRTGRGQHLDVNLLAATLGLLPDPVAHLFDSGKRPARVGNRNPTLTPAEAFRTQDGWLNVVLMNPEQWDRFCRVLGDDVLRTEPRFATNLARLENHEEMKTRVEARPRRRDHGGMGAALRGRVDRGRADLRAGRGLRRPAGPAPRHAGRGGAADVRGARRARADAGLSLPRLGHAGGDPTARSAARGAHRRGAGGDSRALAGRDLGAGRARRDPAPRRLPDARQPVGRAATKRYRVRLKKYSPPAARARRSARQASASSRDTP